MTVSELTGDVAKDMWASWFQSLHVQPHGFDLRAQQAIIFFAAAGHLCVLPHAFVVAAKYEVCVLQLLDVLDCCASR